MNDDELGNAWLRLEPTLPQRRRIDGHVFAWLEAHDTPLASEWLELFRVAPFAGFSLATVSAVAIVAASPLIWLARALI